MGQGGRVAEGGKISAGLRQSEGHPSRQMAVANGVTVALLLLSAFFVIHATHTSRSLYAQLQILESSQWHLQEDYGRLLLEQSTWASHHRVEKVARKELGMRAPDLVQFKVVGQ